jgi:hypothetical protein
MVFVAPKGGNWRRVISFSFCCTKVVDILKEIIVFWIHLQQNIRICSILGAPLHAGLNFLLKLEPIQTTIGIFCKFRYTCLNISIYGYPPAYEIQIFRTVIRTWAPILNSFKRIVSHCALAIVVPERPMRRKVCMRTYAIEEK